MAQGTKEAPDGPIIAGPGAPAIAAVGTSLVVHEWTGSGPSWLHIHRSDDEAWHVLEGSLRFRFADREVDAPAGTTVFVPAGAPHTYWVTVEPSRYLIFLTPEARSPDRPAAQPVRPLRTARHARRIRHRAGGIGCAGRGVGSPFSAVRSRQHDRSLHSAGPSKEAALRMAFSTAHRARRHLGRLGPSMVGNRKLL